MTLHPESRSIVAGVEAQGGGGLGAPPSARVRPKAFTFDGVFGPQTTQEAVYDAVVAPMVARFLEGVNATILAYGQTGSGKTYTMLGAGGGGEEGSHGSGASPLLDETTSGVIPRLARDVLAAVVARNAGEEGAPPVHMRVSVSYVEIYCERIRDLLLPEGVPEPDRGYALSKDRFGNYVTPGVTEVEVRGMEDMANVLR